MSHLRLEMSTSTIVKQLAIATTGAVLFFGSTTFVAKALEQEFYLKAFSF